METTAIKKTKTEQLIDIIVNKGNLDRAEVKLESTWGDLGFDSLDLVELIMEFEKDFGVHISDNTMEDMKTVADAVNYIESNA